MKLRGMMILSNYSEFRQLMMVLSHSKTNLCYFPSPANERIFFPGSCLQKPRTPCFFYFSVLGVLAHIKAWSCITLRVS